MHLHLQMIHISVVITFHKSTFIYLLALLTCLLLLTHTMTSYYAEAVRQRKLLKCQATVNGRGLKSPTDLENTTRLVVIL